MKWHLTIIALLPALSAAFSPSTRNAALAHRSVFPDSIRPAPLSGFLDRFRNTEDTVDEEIVVSDDIPDASLAIEELECEPKEESPLDKIKDLGIAGAVSLGVWEAAFWIIGGGGAAAAYYYANGHFPDPSNKEELATAGGSAFAFINVARLAVPIRVGLAVSTAPWCDENIVKRFFPKDDDVCEVPDI